MKRAGFIAAAMSLLLFAACGGGNNGGGNKQPQIYEDPSEQGVTLNGRVSDTNGNPISGVRVVTGALSAITGGAGTFSIQNVDVVSDRAVITFEKSGYFVLTRSGVKADEMFIEAVLYPRGESDISLQTAFESSEATTLEVTAGMKVELPASSLVRADGSTYSGVVNADMLYLDPNHENFAELMPGGDLAAINSDNNEVMLISWGMTNVNLSDNSGNPLQIKDGSSAELTFPIPAGMEDNPPYQIPLWHFDEDAGIWIETGVATLQGNVYIGEVTHFSWVNLDVPAERVTITGRVLDCENQPVSWVQVKAGQTFAITNSNGYYSVFVPENTPLTVSVAANGGSDSINVPGQPGGATYTAQNLIAPCAEICDGPTCGGEPGEGEEPGVPGTVTDIEKASVKYLMSGGTEYIVTFDRNGYRLRWDMIIAGDMRYTYIINHINKTFWVGFNWLNESDLESWDSYMDYTRYEEYQYQNGVMWLKIPYEETDSPGVPFYLGSDEQGWNPYKQPNRTIAGRSCNVYTFPDQGITYATWNGLMMLVEVNGEVSWMAQAVTLNVPDSAFNRTMNITWIQ